MLCTTCTLNHKAGSTVEVLWGTCQTENSPISPTAGSGPQGGHGEAWHRAVDIVAGDKRPLQFSCNLTNVLGSD